MAQFNIDRHTAATKHVRLQVVASQRFSKAADVYSFGIILWELVTWQVPWEDLNPFQVSRKHNTTNTLQQYLI